MIAGEEGEGDWDPEISGDDMRAALRRLQEDRDALESRSAKKPPALHLKVGDRVVRNKAVGGPLESVPPSSDDLAGTVLQITARRGAGGARARVRVRWDNGHEGSLDDRQLVSVAGSA